MHKIEIDFVFIELGETDMNWKTIEDEYSLVMRGSLKGN